MPTSTALTPGDFGLGRLFENARDALIVVDLEADQVVLWNPAAERLLGYPADEAVGMPVERLLAPGAHPEYRRRQEAWRTDSGFTDGPLPASLITRSGKELAVDVMPNRVTDPRKGTPYLLAIVRKAVSNEQAGPRGQEMASSVLVNRPHSRIYESAVRNLADGLAIMRADHRILSWNPRLEQLLGIPEKHAIGRPLPEVKESVYARTPDPDAARAHCEEALRRAAAGEPAEVQLHLRGASPMELLTRFFRVDGDHTPLSYGWLVRDVTHERAAERLKDELVALVSHELRTPLASIVGFTELLMTRTVSEAQSREYLEIIDREGRRLSNLINHFLDLQRIERGQESVVLRPTDLRELLTQAAAVTSADPNHPLRLDLPPGIPTVMADPDRLQQVLANLLGNASKYSPASGEITVSVSTLPDKQVEVAVRDRGLGIPAEALPRLFEPFYRVRGVDREGIGGTGLGLAISKRLIEAQGGKIRADSAGQGQGSTFSFTLATTDPPKPSDILVVEDDEGFSALLAAELRGRGLSVECTPNAETALAYLSSIKPRALIVDLVLPGLNGDAFLSQVRRMTTSLPVVVVTMQDISRKEQERLEQLGAVSILQKGPSTASAAAARVARLLQ